MTLRLPKTAIRPHYMRGCVSRPYKTTLDDLPGIRDSINMPKPKVAL